MKTLRPHQKKALEYALPRARIALFMEMRLGKTLVAIRWAKAQGCQNILVLGPSSVLPGWKEELLGDGVKPLRIVELKESTQERYEIAEVIAQATPSNKTHWFLTNYECMSENPNMFRIPWDCIILDESTKIKNPQAEISKLLCKHNIHVGFRACLSGAPGPEGEQDYFQQMKFLWDGFMHQQEFWHWRNKYCTNIGYTWVFNPVFAKLFKESLNTSAFTMTRKEAGMGEVKVYEKRYVEMNSLQRKLYEDMEKDFEYTFKNKLKDTKWAPVKYEWMQQIANGFAEVNDSLSNISDAKWQVIKELMRGDLKDEKVVIWFKHNWELEFVERMIIGVLKKWPAVYTGQKKWCEHEFKVKDVQIMLAQPKAAMQGLDWSAASTAIYYSNWPDGEIRIQSEDRIVSTEKKEPLLYIDLVCKDTIDEDIVDLVREKKSKSNNLMKKLNERMEKRYGPSGKK